MKFTYILKNDLVMEILVIPLLSIPTNRYCPIDYDRVQYIHLHV